MAKDIVSKIKSALKNSFSMGPKTIIGIDIGVSSVKMVEMQELRGGNFKILKFGSALLPEGAIIEEEIQNEEEVLAAVKNAATAAKITIQNACIAVAGPNTVVRKLNLAGGSEEEVEDQVFWEAEQYLPFDMDDANVTYHMYGENAGGGVEILMVAAKKDLVQSFKVLLESTGYRVKIVDINAVAIINIFDHVLQEEIHPDDTVIFMDIGAQRTTFIIYNDSKVSFCKEINIGGAMVTEEIQRQLGVNFQEAQNLKTVSKQNQNLPEEVLEVVDDVLEIFFKEIKKTIDFFMTAFSDEKFSSCWITGGGALTPNLQEGLEVILEMPVKTLDPLTVIEYNSSLSGEDLEFIKKRGAVVLGLGMRNRK